MSTDRRPPSDPPLVYELQREPSSSYDDEKHLHDEEIVDTKEAGEIEPLVYDV